MSIINIDRIQSTVLAADPEKYYLPKVKKKITYWKRISVKVHKPRLVLNTNRWFSNTDYYVFCIIFGNTVDFLPITVTIAVQVACGAWNTILVISTFLFVMPIIYVETFLGKYTRLSNGQLYKLAPICYGFCVMIFLINSIYVPLKTGDLIVVCMQMIQLLLNPMYLNECDEYSENCYDYSIHGPINKTDCIKIELGFACEGQIYRYISAYNYWDLLENSMSLFRIRGMAIMILLSAIVNSLSMINMKIIGLALKMAFIFNFVFLTLTFVMALLMPGSRLAFKHLLDFTFDKYGMSEIITTVYYSLTRIGIVSPSGYMTYASANYTKANYSGAIDTLITVSLNMLLSIYYTTVYLTVLEGLAKTFMVSHTNLLVELNGIYTAVIPEFLKIRGCPNMFIIFFFLSTILLDLVKLSILLRMHMLNLYDFLPQIIPYRSYIRIGTMIFFIITILTFSISTPLYVNVGLSDIFYLQGLKLLGECTMIFYCYGVSRLDDDFHFHYGSRPVKFWRIMWYIYPMVMFFTITLTIVFNIQGFHTCITWEGSPENLEVIHTSMVIIIIWSAIIFVSTVLYIMSTIKKVHTIKLLNPLFSWGPPDLEMRKARKMYAPRTSIRSESTKKKKIRWRTGSLRKMHDMDSMTGKSKGYIFMDSSFFTNIATLKMEPAKDKRIKVQKLLI